MSLCAHCGREMLKADGGDEQGFIAFPDGAELDPIPWDGPIRCPDCNAKDGHPHHVNCDQERCPKCDGQLITCGCLFPSIH